MTRIFLPALLALAVPAHAFHLCREQLASIASFDHIELPGECVIHLKDPNVSTLRSAGYFDFRKNSKYRCEHHGCPIEFTNEKIAVCKGDLFIRAWRFTRADELNSDDAAKNEIQRVEKFIDASDPVEQRISVAGYTQYRAVVKFENYFIFFSADYAGLAARYQGVRKFLDSVRDVVPAQFNAIDYVPDGYQFYGNFFRSSYTPDRPAGFEELNFVDYRTATDGNYTSYRLFVDGAVFRGGGGPNDMCDPKLYFVNARDFGQEPGYIYNASIVENNRWPCKIVDGRTEELPTNFYDRPPQPAP